MERKNEAASKRIKVLPKPGKALIKPWRALIKAG